MKFHINLITLLGIFFVSFVIANAQEEKSEEWVLVKVEETSEVKVKQEPLIDYNQPCDLENDLCDRSKFLQCGTSRHCECYNKPQAFYDPIDKFCKLLSQAECNPSGGIYQKCVRNSKCDPLLQRCTCDAGFFENSQRRCFLEHSTSCVGPTVPENDLCDPAGFLTCQQNGDGYQCLCDKRDDAWYNTNTKVCHIRTGTTTCSLLPEEMPCVPNSHCDEYKRECTCDGNLVANQDRMCYLQYGDPCEELIDLCNKDGYMSCSSQGECTCRPQDEAKYDNSTRTCKLLDDAPCSVFPSSQSCILNALCVPAEGSEPHRCQCQYNLEGNKNRECYLMYGISCERSRDQCDPEGFLSCGISNKCECSDSSANYDPVMKECRYNLGTPCSTSGGAQPCGLNAQCVNGFCECLPLYEDGGGGICLRSYGSPCSQSDICNTRNNLECLRGNCACSLGFLESYAENEMSPYKVKCLPGYQMPCSENNNTIYLPCNPEAQLRCLNGKCDCASPGEQVYQADSNRCGTMIGNRCRDNGTFDECVENASCNSTSGSDIFGTCQCDFGYRPNFGGGCTNNGFQLYSSITLVLIFATFSSLFL